MLSFPREIVKLLDYRLHSGSMSVIRFIPAAVRLLEWQKRLQKAVRKVYLVCLNLNLNLLFGLFSLSSHLLPFSFWVLALSFRLSAFIVGRRRR